MKILHRRQFLHLTTGAAALPAASMSQGAEFIAKWKSSARWDNTSGTPISFFEATWKVPPPPKKRTDKNIHLFPGLTNAQNRILQPVLQWGSNPATPDGGDGWSVASWC